MLVWTATIDWWRARDLLVRALVLSVLIHGLLYGTWSLGNSLQLWKRNLFPSWLLPVKSTRATVEEAINRSQERQRQIPVVFVDVSPRQATPDAPEDTPFYSAMNSRAANPDQDIPSEAPKIEGEQTKVFKTEETRQSQARPLQPSPPVQPEESPTEQPEQVKAEPRPAQPIGDLAMARPAPQPRDTRGEDEEEKPEEKPREKPRTLAEARARLGIQGEPIKQMGGVSRRLEFSSVDAKATPFGAYDAALIAAVQSYWYGLLEKTQYDGARAGHVAIEFRLMPDGRVVDLRTMDETVGTYLSLLCERSIQAAAPFGPWPSDMRRMLGDSRHVKFTFYYQ